MSHLVNVCIAWNFEFASCKYDFVLLVKLHLQVGKKDIFIFFDSS